MRIKIITLSWPLLLSALLFSCKKKEPPKAPMLDLAQQYEITSSFDKKSSILTVGIKLNDGLHAYAKGEKIGKPVRLEIVDKNGWQALGTTDIPAGKNKDLGTLGKSVVLTGDVNLRQRVKSGTGEGRANLHLQVCTESVCDRPRVHSLTFH
jgi:hypothetical protein